MSATQRKTTVSRWRDIRLNVLISAASFLLACLVIEIVLRTVHFDPYGMPVRRVDIRQGGVYSPGVFWGTSHLKRPAPFPGLTMGEYIPGLDFRFVYASNPRNYFDKENAVYAHISSLGTRGADFSKKKAPGSFRIMGLGDSFTFGEGVRTEDVFLSRLQNMLGRSGGRKYEVINCGVSSYNTRDEVVYLENKWMEFKPDLVLLTFVVNDGYDDGEFGPLHQGFTNGATRLYGDAGRRPVSVLWAWITSLYQRRRVSRETTRMYMSQFTANPVMRGYTWEDSRRMLARAAETCRRNGARFAVIIFPELYMLDENYPFREIHRQVKEEGLELGIPVLDLFDSFCNMNDRELWVHPTDHHPNEKAHAIAAEAILKFITDKKNGLIR